MHYAADFGHSAVVDYLITKGAEINATDKHDITPLLAAIYEGEVYMDCYFVGNTGIYEGMTSINLVLTLDSGHP